MNCSRADALVAAALADIAVFAAIAEDDDRLALERRFNGQLNAAQRSVIERGLAAVGQIVYGGEQPVAVGRVIGDLPDAGAEGDDRYRVIRLKRFNITASGRLSLGQRPVGHAAAGIHDQHSSEIQVIVGDVLDIADLGQAAQVAADGKVLHAQAGYQPFALIEYAGVNGDLA